MGSESTFKLPVIHLMKESLKPGTSSWVEACKFVTQAFEEYGCFLAIHDQFSAEFRDDVFMALQGLFNLPAEIKVKNTSEIPFFGYYGTNPFLPLYESTSIEDATKLESIQSFANHMWPSGNNHFCDMLHSYAKKLSEIDEMVSRMVFESYGVEKHHDSHGGSVIYFLRFTKYRVPQENETNLGATAHTDKNFMTVLDQIQADGLEVQLKDGNWIDVDFPPSSLVIMAGDAFSAWSNGRLHVPLHRVTMKGKVTRYSAAQFSYMSKMVQAPEELVDDEHPLLYKPFDNFGLLRFLSTEEGKAAQNLLRTYCGV